MQLHTQVKVEHRQRFQELIGRVYHKDHIPRAKRIRGLSNVGLAATLRLLNHLALASKNPEHVGYVTLALAEAHEAMEYWRLAQQVSLELEENVISTVKEFEHYQ